MNVVVQKFGGTSVSTHSGREASAKKIKNAIEMGNSVVAVVSAMGRKGDPYATDTMLELIYEGRSSKRDKDLLMSCGELISSVIMASLLNTMGLKACAVTGYQAGIVTDGISGSANCIAVNCDYIRQLLNEGYIPVVTGFQGIFDFIEITTLGRGGSDTTAALLGSALKANRIEIYTDVDGIMTADPRVVKNASIIDEISGEEVFQMADQGAKVIHSKAVDAAMLGGIDMYIKNTFTDAKGTKITPDLLLQDDTTDLDVITSIASMKNRAQVTIQKVGESKESVILHKLANGNVSIDLINIFADYMVFTIDEDDIEDSKKIFKELDLEYSILKGLSKVTVIGSKMRGIPGVTARIVTALLEANCDILQSADSHMHISCLLKKEDEERAVIALHNAFNLGK